MKHIYSDRYDLNLGAHVFPAVKYRLIKERLLAEKLAAPDDFIEPEAAHDEDLTLVHRQDYVRKLKLGKLSYVDLMRLEIPHSPELVQALWLSAGGSILAARLALDKGERIVANIGGGFHHAFPDHGEGFCALNDVAVAIRKLQKEKAIERALVVDCDVHQGNGTAAIFAGDLTVFTLSIHQENNYPFPKPPSSLDINLPDRTDDAAYLDELQKGLTAAFERFEPDLFFFVAGADPYKEDQLGGLALTLEGLKARDELVLRTALERNIPTAIVLAGGYARKVEDTVRIHCNTLVIAHELLSHH